MNWKSRVAGDGREITVFYMTAFRHVRIIRRATAAVYRDAMGRTAMVRCPLRYRGAREAAASHRCRADLPLTKRAGHHARPLHF